MPAGEFESSAVSPNYSADLVEIQDSSDEFGPQHPKERVYRATFELSSSQDAYLVATFTSSHTGFPVLNRTGTTFFAYTNPIFVDVDGGGYNHPPLTPFIYDTQISNKSHQASSRVKTLVPPLQKSTDIDYAPLLEALEPHCESKNH